MSDFLFYLQLGWEHIIGFGALDHQLFILALVVVFGFSDYKKMLILVTAFTIGHSITLVLSSLDIIRFPSNWVELLIPCTIVFTAIDTLIFNKDKQKMLHFHYILALFFGCIHGMGFANSVRLMLATEQSVFLPLFGFNLGLELGQIVVVLLSLLVFYVFSKFLKISQKKYVLWISLIILLISIKMTIDRFS